MESASCGPPRNRLPAVHITSADTTSHYPDGTTTMDPQERKNAQESIRIYQAVVLAMERRHDVLDAVWASSTAEEARQRLRDQLGVDDIGAQAILDLQVHHLTSGGRQRFTGHLEQLEDLLRNDGTPST
jgi:DNA gyrase/topoisomerase IV subunit A